MECAFTICAVLYVPYGHGRNTNWNISISFSLHWQTTVWTVLFPDLTRRNHKKCSNARQIFTLKTQNGRNSMMLFRWQLAVGIMTPSRSICLQVHRQISTTNKSSKQTVHWKGSVQLLGDLLIGPSARWLTSSLIPIEVLKWFTNNIRRWSIQFCSKIKINTSCVSLGCFFWAP